MNKLQLLEVIRLTAPAEVANAVSDICEREQRARVELAIARGDGNGLVRALLDSHNRRNNGACVCYAEVAK